MARENLEKEGLLNTVEKMKEVNTAGVRRKKKTHWI